MPAPLVSKGPVQQEIIPESCFAPPPKPDFDGKIIDSCKGVEIYVSELGTPAAGDTRILRFHREQDHFVFSESNTKENSEWFHSHPDSSRVWEYLSTLKDPLNSAHTAYLRRRRAQSASYEEQKNKAGLLFHMDGLAGFFSGNGIKGGDGGGGFEAGLSVYSPHSWSLGGTIQGFYNDATSVHSFKPSLSFILGSRQGGYSRFNSFPVLKFGPLLGATSIAEEDQTFFHYGASVEFQYIGFFGGNEKLGTSLIGVGTSLLHLPEENAVRLMVHGNLNLLGLIIWLGGGVLD